MNGVISVPLTGYNSGQNYEPWKVPLVSSEEAAGELGLGSLRKTVEKKWGKKGGINYKMEIFVGKSSTNLG